MKHRLYILLALTLTVSCTKEAVKVDAVVSSQKSEESCLIQGEAIVEFSEEFTAQVEKDFAEGNFLSTKAGNAAVDFDAVRLGFGIPSHYIRRGCVQCFCKLYDLALSNIIYT